jgi:hypothetical protein
MRPAGPDEDLRSPSSQRHGSPPHPAAVLTAAGTGSIVLGGLVAAVTGPLDLAHGSWLAAYLVLVGGVAQCAMGRAQLRRPEATPPRHGWAQFGCWNLGNVLVIGATLAGEPLVVDLGSVLLVIALAIALRAVRPDPAAGGVPALIDRAYRALLLVLMVSIPVGMTLSHLRHS